MPEILPQKGGFCRIKEGNLNLLNALLFAIINLQGLTPAAAVQTDSHSLQLAVDMPDLQKLNQETSVAASPALPVPPDPAPAPEPPPAPKPAPPAPPRPKPAPPRPTYPPLAPNDAKMFIYMHESGNNPTRRNASGCLGLGQACPGSKLLAVCPTLDYNCEDNFFTGYALSRYGSWQNAYNFWVAHLWW